MESGSAPSSPGDRGGAHEMSLRKRPRKKNRTDDFATDNDISEGSSGEDGFFFFLKRQNGCCLLNARYAFPCHSISICIEDFLCKIHR